MEGRVLADKERVFFFRAAAIAAGTPGQLAEDLDGSLDSSHQAAPSRRGFRMASWTVVAVCSMRDGQIGDKAVDALDLARRRAS